MKGSIWLYWRYREVLACVLAIVAVVVFTVLSPNFLGLGNIYAVVQSFGVLAIVATGLMLTMVAGEFDLSVAGTVPLAGIITISVAQVSNAWIGILVAVAACVGIGILNGFITAYFRLPSLAVTVGTMLLAIGLGFAISRGQVVTITDFSFTLALDQPLLGVFSARSLTQLLLVALVGVMLSLTWWGLAIRSVGSDSSRAIASRVSPFRTIILVFVISGAFAGVAGSLQSLSLGAGVLGDNQALLLQAVTAAIIGGTALTGGRGTVVGVAAGALLLSVLANGLGLLGATTALIQLTNGALLLIVILVNRPFERAIKVTLDRRLAGPSALKIVDRAMAPLSR